jgi:hypothetical protein
MSFENIQIRLQFYQREEPWPVQLVVFIRAACQYLHFLGGEATTTIRQIESQG